MIHVDSGSPTFSTDEAVLFPFDDYSIPFRKDVLMTLVPGSRQPGEHRENASYEPNHPGVPVVENGPPGTCDSMEIVFPSIARVGDELEDLGVEAVGEELACKPHSETLHPLV